ncbi:Hypp95 [Branchiostoma lanceolatum]|uniref:Hypp95 protein n=1 Tax=Branchiostoma lanceolatum TaxID=7740 RepID=A0A8J9VRZ1_BRALA|nr:Hypp95 [Branchiostoma lanceolatum]
MDEVSKFPKQCTDDLVTKRSQELGIDESLITSDSTEDLRAGFCSLLSKMGFIIEEKEALVTSRDSIIKEKEKIAKDRDEAVAEKEAVKKENETLKKKNEAMFSVQHEMEKKVIQLEAEVKLAKNEAGNKRELREQLRESLKKTEERLEKTESELEEFRKDQKAIEAIFLTLHEEKLEIASRRHLYDRIKAVTAGEGVPTDSSTDENDDWEYVDVYESIEETEEPANEQKPPPLPMPRDALLRRSGKKCMKKRIKKALTRGKNKNVTVQGNNNTVHIGASEAQGGSPDKDNSSGVKSARLRTRLKRFTTV